MWIGSEEVEDSQCGSELQPLAHRCGLEGDDSPPQEESRVRLLDREQESDDSGEVQPRRVKQGGWRERSFQLSEGETRDEASVVIYRAIKTVMEDVADEAGKAQRHAAKPGNKGTRIK